MSEPLHIAFVWHMHQPYYRISRDAPFQMPWARMHALKDYLDMLEILGQYPDLHQTFNMVPSLVEQLEDYSSGDFVDVYWEHTLKPADDLTPNERAFVVERMCERADHPRAYSHPRYLELASKRAANAPQGWEACAASFTTDELRDLQVWFNLAWFDPVVLETGPLSELVARGSHFREDDKSLLAEVQGDLLGRTLPAYREAAAHGQIEISTSPYFHPILPLLVNTDSARIADGNLLLPCRRFAYPQDALEQVELGVAKHEAVFGHSPQGMWCSEQAVGEDVIPLLLKNGIRWTISDETILARSLSGVSHPTEETGRGANLSVRDLQRAYRLDREEGQLSIIFRDHTLSDLIGFAYCRWSARDAANDLLYRLREIHRNLDSAGAYSTGASSDRGSARDLPLVTIALDGENAWEYYTRDGRDFLQYLYEGLQQDPSLRCVTVSEHLAESPAVQPLGWLHTGSWIGGDLGTWIGDRAHGVAWELLRDARENIENASAPLDLQAAREQIRIAEGSDWFWWFGDHHHTSLDAVWDLTFRQHLQESYRLAGTEAPLSLLYPVCGAYECVMPASPSARISPQIDGLMDPDEWAAAGRLTATTASTMQRAGGMPIREVRYGRDEEHLFLLVSPNSEYSLAGTEIQVQLPRSLGEEELVFVLTLTEDGGVRTQCKLNPKAAEGARGVWREVVEVSLPLSEEPAAETGLTVRIGHDGMVEHVFHSAHCGP